MVLFYFLFSSIIQKDNIEPSGASEDNNASLNEQAYPDSNSETFKANHGNRIQNNDCANGQLNDTQDIIDENESDDMFFKIIETEPLNKKLGQLIKKKTKTRTLAKCKVCACKISWFKRSQHRKEHSKLSLVLSSSIPNLRKKRSLEEESQQNLKLSQNKELNSNQIDRTIAKPPDLKRHKGKLDSMTEYSS